MQQRTIWKKDFFYSSFIVEYEFWNVHERTTFNHYNDHMSYKAYNIKLFQKSASFVCDLAHFAVTKTTTGNCFYALKRVKF